MIGSIIFFLVLKFFVYKFLELPLLLQGETYNKSVFDFDYEILFDRFLIVSKYYLMFLLNNILMLISLISLISLLYLLKNNIF